MFFVLIPQVFGRGIRSIPNGFFLRTESIYQSAQQTNDMSME